MSFVAFSSPSGLRVGRDEASLIELPAPWVDHVDIVAIRLATLGDDAIAFGALPFDRGAAGQLFAFRSATGSPASEPAPSPFPAGTATSASPPIEVTSVRDPRDWCEAVRTATERIRSDDVTKVVLARELRLRAAEPLDPVGVFASLRERYPHALCFAVDGFVGASPELLVARDGDTVRAQPMAGTTERTGDAPADRLRASDLLGSEKNRWEHQITIDMVHDTVLPWCSYLDAEPQPSVVAAGPVQHLATVVEGHLSSPRPSVLDLVAALHPTPAVGGWPRDAALEIIDELELADRGAYAGPVGWVDSAGNGEWAVGIRSMQIDGRSASLFAGVGVVADSDPQVELAETTAKAHALLDVIG